MSGQGFNGAGQELHTLLTDYIPEVQIQVKCRTASFNNQDCQLCLRQSQQQPAPVGEFQVELRQEFLAETPRSGESSTGTSQYGFQAKDQLTIVSIYLNQLTM